MAAALNGNRTLRALDWSVRRLDEGGIKAMTGFIRSNPSLRELNLVPADSAAAVALANALRRTHTLRRLDVSHSSGTIGPAGAQAITDALLGCTSLQELNLSGHAIGSESAVGVASLLHRWSALSTLRLSRCALTQGSVDAIAAVLGSSRSLSHLDLSGNALTNIGVDALFTAAGEGALESLDLGGCVLAAADVASLCRQLEGSTSLTRLVLDTAEIDVSAAKAIARLLSENGTIVDLSLGRCVIYEKCVRILAGGLGLRCVLHRLSLSRSKLSDMGVAAL
jgi:Ran GTPase-activating protein (RanGAP) involved in mRNA processing and transport